jgi:hypothetical protein
MHCGDKVEIVEGAAPIPAAPEKVVYVPQPKEEKPWWTTGLMVLGAFVQFSVGCAVSIFFLGLLLGFFGLDGLSYWLSDNIVTISMVVGGFKALTIGVAFANTQ